MEIDMLTEYTERPSEERIEVMTILLRNISDGFIVADQDGEFILWNRRATEILGKGPTDKFNPQDWTSYYGCYYEDKITPMPAEKLPLRLALAGIHTENMVMYIENEVKTTWILVTATPIKLENGTGGMIFIKDITQGKQRDAEAAEIILALRRIKNEQLEILNRV